jgi:hypothetical protein
MGRDECSGSKFDRQSRQGGIVLLSIFGETGKSRLSVKLRHVGGELHCKFRTQCIIWEMSKDRRKKDVEKREEEINR